MKKTAEQIVQENLKTIEEWAIQGMSRKEIAECLGIGYSTFRAEINKSSGTLALFRKIAKSKKEANKNQIEAVEKSLFERAKGYEVIETVPVKVKKNYTDENGNKCSEEQVVIVEQTKHVPADVGAAKFFLTNRSKKEWQDNPHKVVNDAEILKIRKKEVEGKEW